MLTLDFEAHCLPASTLDETPTAPLWFGGAGELCAIFVQGAPCTAGAGGKTAKATAGVLVLAGGPVRLCPQGEVHLTGCALAGGAPAQLAAQLAAPLVLDATACPGAPELIARLAAGDLPPAEQSALGYTLACRVAAARAEAPLPPLVAAAVAEMREHYAEVYGIEELAAQLGVSKSHLVRSFAAATGTTPGRFLTAVRIEVAKGLLLHREYTLEVVASLCGFSGANYLCKVFKKETGATPAAWRQRAEPAAPAKFADEWEQRLFL